ncbi:luxQ [Symbiodinium natans]|uniref:LuxQ protein n=1 Tax=Symbiodinium natans TaxID=878477 RepID=A0A812JZQ4_9DINO|nr:luxQ [Symbiodinium natans]
MVRGARVLELGCGNGLCSLVAASLGASVLASDYRQLPLDLLRAAADACGARVSERLQTTVLDFADPMPSALAVSTRHRAEKVSPTAEPLPDHDLLIAADVGYSKALAWRLGERCRESLQRGRRVLVCESRQMPECRLAFSEALNLDQKRVYRLAPREPVQVETGAPRCQESIRSLWYLDAGGGG